MSYPSGHSEAIPLKRRLLIALLLPLLAGCTPLAAQLARGGATDARYRLVASADLRRVDGEVRLGPRSGPVLLRLQRRRGWEARRRALKDMRCLDGRALAPFGDHGWVLPAACSGARWTVSLMEVPVLGYEVPGLRAAVAPREGWAILPGAAVLLVPHAYRGPATLELQAGAGVSAHHALDSAPDGRLRLPELPDAADVLIGLGRFASHTARAGDLTMRHLFAGPPPAPLARIVQEDGRALAYLRAVLGSPRARQWQVFWFPTARSALPLGGAAARRSLAVTWRDGVRPAPHLHPTLLPWLPLLILLHEQVHLFLGDRPTWLGESLAQFYALKALGRAGLVPATAWETAWQAVTRPWSPTPEADAKVPLLTAVRRYRRHGDPRAYGLLYTNGARFWHALDDAIRTHGRHPTGLDAVLRRLLALPFDTEDALPAGFVALLREAAGPAADRLMRRYVTGASGR